MPASRDGADLFTVDERLKLLSFTGSPGVGWDLKAKAGKKPVILELGGNDGLRGIATEVTKQNLQAIIDKTRARYSKVRLVLAGMEVPTNLGPVYTARFRSLYPELALENTTDLIPFLLEGVGGVRELNLPDGIHPTVEGHQIVAETVWKTLRPVLEAVRGAA